MEKQTEKSVRNRRGILKRFWRDEDGVTALEFGIVSIPLFITLGVMIEFALGFFVHTMLSHGAADVARLVRTKQVTASSHSEAQFKQIICDRPVMAMFDCDSLIVDVQEVAQFNSPTVPREDDGSIDSTNMGFGPGGSYSINVMRLYYEFPVFMPWMKNMGGPSTPNGRLLVATQAFMVEP